MTDHQPNTPDTLPDQRIVDLVHAAIVWYKAPPQKQATAEASLRRAVGIVLHQPESKR